MKKLIIAIDPGKGGGIAYQCNGKTAAVDMPKTVTELNNFLRFLTDTYGRPLVFIEKVQAFQDDKNAGGKNFGINKMLANYSELLTILRIINVPMIQVYPVTWQSRTGLKKGFPKGEPKNVRKGRYKEFAQQKFPEVKATLKTSDALCILHFGMMIMHDDINWVIERVENTVGLPEGQLF